MFLWQALAVRFNFDGNWTGLYCIGDRIPQPPALSAQPWIFHKTAGYDGQWYRLMSHDPWQQRGFDRFMDDPRLRYDRILLPGLAHLLAAGQDRYVEAAYLLLVLAFLFLGTFWLGSLAEARGLSPWLGLGFALVPASLVSIDRMTVDVALAALCVAFAWFAETAPGWPLYLVLLAAPLDRDTGFVLLIGYAGQLLLERRPGRAAVVVTAGIPAVLWYEWVAVRTPADPTPWFGSWPLSGYVHRLLNPWAYASAAPIAIAATLLDYAALAGIGMAIAWAAWLATRRPDRVRAVPILAFAVLAVLINRDDVWAEAFGFGRVLSPLLLLLALHGLAQRLWTPALPLLLVVPRILLQIAPLGWQILKGLAGWLT